MPDTSDLRDRTENQLIEYATRMRKERDEWECWSAGAYVLIKSMDPVTAEQADIQAGLLTAWPGHEEDSE